MSERSGASELTWRPLGPRLIIADQFAELPRAVSDAAAASPWVSSILRGVGLVPSSPSLGETQRRCVLRDDAAPSDVLQASALLIKINLIS